MTDTELRAAKDLLMHQAAEIERLRAALEELRILGVQGAPPDYTRWLAFHDKVAEIATKALNEQ